MAFCAQRINIHGRFVFVVLTPVDQHFPLPQRLEHPRNHPLGRSLLDPLREALRERLGFVVRRCTVQRDVNLQPF